MVEITIRKRPRTDAVQTQRKFFKKTAKGKVLKGLLRGLCPSRSQLRSCFFFSQIQVIRERYLRDDVPCGLFPCSICSSEPEEHKNLPLRGSLGHSLFPSGHLLVPDTNVFLHQVRRTIISYPSPLMISSLDGSSRVCAFQPAYYFASNCHRRSPPSISASVQPFERSHRL